MNSEAKPVSEEYWGTLLSGLDDAICEQAWTLFPQIKDFVSGVYKSLIAGPLPDYKRVQVAPIIQELTRRIVQLNEKIRTQSSPDRIQMDASLAQDVAQFLLKKAFGPTGTNDSLTREETLREDLERAQSEIALLQSRLNQAVLERQKAAVAAAKVGVDVHAQNFEQLCRRNSIQSWWWVAVVACLTAAATSYVYFSLQNSKVALTDATPAIVLHEFLPRLLIFSALYFVIVWAARNFSAARHNHTINSHRAAALKSFDAFTAATEGDKELRLAILKQVTTAIFEAQPTAYLKEEHSGKDGNLIQVFADAIKSKGKGE